jgi:hypothetical protein
VWAGALLAVVLGLLLASRVLGRPAARSTSTKAT